MDITENSHYEATAFNSTKDSFHLEEDKRDSSLRKDKFRETAIPLKIICNEILTKGNSIWMLSAFSLGDRFYDRFRGKYKLWETLEWETQKNPRVYIRNAKNIFLFLAIAFFITEVLFLVTSTDGFLTDTFSAAVFLMPFLFYFAFLYLYKKTKSKYNVIFNRRTGVVSIPRKGESLFTARFNEFKPYCVKQHVLHGVNNYLYLGHYHESVGAINPEGSKNEAGPYAEWSFICQFMDISMPLPEIPLFEPVRQFDPTTKSYDAKTGRPERFWRNMDIDVAEKIVLASEKRLRNCSLSKNIKVSLDNMQWPSITNS